MNRFPLRLLAAALSLVWLTVAVPAGADPQIIGGLTVADRWLVDSAGRVVIVHGENVVSKTAPYTPQHYGFDTADAEFLRDNQFNGIRLGIMWEAVEPSPGEYDDAYLDTIRRFVTTAADHGIYTTVEFHQDRWGSALGGAGAPPWATRTDGFPDVSGSIVTAQFSPAIYQAFSHFFADSPAPDGRGLLDHFTRAWQHTATRLRGTPGLAGYGILNEPSIGIFQDLCITGTCPVDSPQQRLRRFTDRVATAIRAADPTAPIVESGYILSAIGAVEQVPPSALPDLVHGYNSYALPCTGALHPPIDWCLPFYRDAMAHAGAVMRDEHRPALLTEFGATANTEVLTAQAELADAEMSSWYHWNYGGNDPTTTATSPEIEGLLVDARRPPVRANLHAATLAALVRPYPQRVSGTPRGWRFDRATGRFDFTYSPARADGTGEFPVGSRTVIAVPALVYPGGSTVSVQGGRVVAVEPGRVIVESDSSTADISVVVTPAAP
ncbi:cellulase family glycosylhydrolase [Nocardia sp. SSK8]|uniref:cellulase family glycosylhydrolase n=1 Tax=Nocardia sp. SSK8 TaxID=3120154 RepID=UPI003008A33C